MTKGKKTTQRERSEIVAFCLEHGKDYLLTAEQYGVSRQQIYTRVRKYEQKGIDGLVRGSSHRDGPDYFAVDKHISK